MNQTLKAGIVGLVATLSLLLGIGALPLAAQSIAQLDRLLQRGIQLCEDEPAQAEPYLLECLAGAEQIDHPWYTSAALIWLGECAYAKQDYKLLLRRALTAKEIVEHRLCADTVRHYFLILQSAGVASSYLGNIEAQRHYYNEGLQFCNEYFPSDLRMRADAYFNLSAAYYKTFALDSAIIWTDSTLRITQKEGFTDLSLTTLLNRSVIYANFYDYDKAIQTQQEALKLTKNKNEIILLHCHLTEYHAILNQADKAKKNLAEARRLVAPLPGKELPQYYYMVELTACELFYQLDKQAFTHTLDNLYRRIPDYDDNVLGDYKRTLNWVARSQLDAHQYAAAEATCKKALQTRADKQFPEVDIRTYLLLADALSLQGQYKAALAQLQTALVATTPNFSSTRIQDNPAAIQFTNLKFGVDILNAKMKVWLAMHRHQPNPKALYQALSVYRTADTLLYDRRRLLHSDLSRSVLSSSAQPMHQQAVALFFTLYETEGAPHWIAAAFRCMERSRTLIVSEHLTRQQAEAAVPDDILQQERLLKQTSYRLQQLIGLSEQGNFSPTQKQEWERQRYATEQKWTQLLALIETNYPDYYRTKYKPPFVSHTDVQQRLLGRREVLLSFSEQDSVVYCVGITRRKLFFKRLTPDKPLHQTVPALRDALLARSSAFYSLAHGLYRDLLAPMEAEWAGKDLVLLPEGRLWYVPFSALPTRATESRYAQDQDFLITKSTVRCLYAAHGALLPRVHRPHTEYTWAVFAPFSQSGYRAGEQSLPHLPGSGTEGQRIQERLKKHPGVLRLGPDAQLPALEQIAPATQVMHLVSHTFINPHDPNLSTLYFAQSADSSQYSLTIYDIIGKQWPFDLTVLSACESNEGPLQGGEGVAGIARGFAMAGCHNLMATLWVVNDKSTVSLMDAYYAELAKGCGKAKALRCAQNAYLTDATHLTSLHPYYWAGFIHIGDAAPLSLPGIPVGAIIGGGLLLLCGLYLGWQYRHQKG